jgi:7-cyano-7-deazaguanine synthase in queuosine biosynthesis
MNMIRYVGRTQCCDAAYRRAVDSGEGVLIDWVSLRPNATVSFTLNGKAVAPGLQGTPLDFTDLGVFVYLADEMVNRAEATDYWTRTIRCLVPTAEPAKWQENELLLSNTLELLSGDLWKFDWVPLTASRPVSNHRQRLPRGFDAVCLFSGGTDSLLGAIRLLREGRKVILVGHQSEGQAASAQKDLADNLRDMFPGQTCLVQCRVSRSTRRTPEFDLSPKVERSHRPRSFLFLTLGVGIALRCGIRDVFMPENGLMALNIPLQKSRTGALSTRTAHPSYMMQFADLAQRITGFDGQIRNPFLTQSKTDMLRGLDPTLHPAVLRSISCARPSRYNDRGVRHCGYCVPCIHRRIALVEAGIDSASHYAFDVFRNFASLDASKQQDICAVVKFANRIVNASVTQLQTLILSHGHFPATVSAVIGYSETRDYTPWTNMLRNWAQDLLNKLEATMPSSARLSLGAVERRRRIAR